MDNHVYSPFIQCFPVDLVITRYPEILSVVPRILWAYCLAVLCHLNTPTDNSRTYRVSAHPQLIQVFHKSVQNTIRSSENPQEPFCSWNSCLLALWLILSLVILLASLVIIILSPLIQFVANARNPQSYPRIHSSGSDDILNVSWISTYQIAIDCTPKPTQLIHPWSERCFWPPDLEIIILLHLNFELVSCFYNQISWHSSSSGWVPMLTSDPLWTIGSFVGFYPTVSFILNNLVSLSMSI